MELPFWIHLRSRGSLPEPANTLLLAPEKFWPKRMEKAVNQISDSKNSG